MMEVRRVEATTAGDEKHGDEEAWRGEDSEDARRGEGSEDAWRGEGSEDSFPVDIVDVLLGESCKNLVDLVGYRSESDGASSSRGQRVRIQLWTGLSTLADSASFSSSSLECCFEFGLNMEERISEPRDWDDGKPIVLQQERRRC